ncbi:hypothetical protein NPIL_136321 [Nephila pilipes]|uniref:Uncharacterized protein n=1 Tax=Nephila pilipes TaxID=299642 RepID=A0A8X6UBF1_NEPPI|nr:hypothetical protein NPIL_136321 [Nephila pilipes]
MIKSLSSAIVPLSRNLLPVKPMLFALRMHAMPCFSFLCKITPFPDCRLGPYSHTYRLGADLRQAASNEAIYTKSDFIYVEEDVLMPHCTRLDAILSRAFLHWPYSGSLVYFQVLKSLNSPGILAARWMLFGARPPRPFGNVEMIALAAQAAIELPALTSSPPQPPFLYCAHHAS